MFAQLTAALRQSLARRRLTARVRRGYTVVEVMMALSVLSIGATGIVAMQKVTLLGNTQARDLATASAIGAAWIERLHQDAVRWRYDPATQLTTLANTTYLSQAQGAWFLPAAGTGAMLGTQPTTDVKGMDVDAATVPRESAFCVSIQLQTLQSNPPARCAAGNTCPSSIRAEVRVHWLRLHNTRLATIGGSAAGAAGFCTAAELALLELTANEPRYHYVYMTSAILRNDQ